MRVSRLYLTRPLETGLKIVLDDDSAHYLRTVLRLKKGANITLFNGTGGEFSSIIEEANRKIVLIQIKEHIQRNAESPLRTDIGLGVSRGERMDIAVQKVVELGVNHISPILTDHCVVQLKDENKQQKLRHWQKIVQHATEQCGRTVVPQVDQPQELTSWVENQEGLKIFLDPYANFTLAELTPINNRVTLLTGPEGGFSERERALAKYFGFVPVCLGRRILRAETASLAAMAAVQMLWGDFVTNDH
jgi:16S rRNA (uracil1498-N3)-methyltransferase